jgi:hypothetical protein
MFLSIRRKNPRRGFTPKTAAARTRLAELCINAGSQWLQGAAALMVSGCVLTLAASCPAQRICPWMNVATASGYMGGPASAAVNQTSDSAGTCVFTLLSGTAKESLTISVAPAENGDKYLASYGLGCISPAQPLRAIGNEAMMCAVTAATSHGEQVVGRVRDSIFIVAMASQAPANRGGAREASASAEKVESVAEQVAGNLF